MICLTDEKFAAGAVRTTWHWEEPDRSGTNINVDTWKISAFYINLERIPKCFLGSVFWTREKEGGSYGDASVWDKTKSVWALQQGKRSFGFPMENSRGRYLRTCVSMMNPVGDSRLLSNVESVRRVRLAGQTLCRGEPI
jgi:hypothetical protein